MALHRQRVAESPVALAAGRRHTVFTLGGVLYAMEATHVKQLLSEAAGAAEVARLVGRPCPLLDLRTLFRLPPPSQPAPFVLVVEEEGRIVALRVDAINGLITLSDAQIAPLPLVFSGIERDWYRGFSRMDGALVVVLRVDGIVRYATGLPRAAAG